MTSSLDQTLMIAASTLAVLGLVLLVLGYRRDPSRGRRRCPVCWYDMADVAGLTCPECGKPALREKRLYRTRRSVKLFVVGFALVAIGAGVLQYARAGSPPPIRLVPEAMLMWLEPEGQRAFHVDPNGTHHLRLVPSELARRAASGTLSKSAWQRIIDRGIITRHAWPEGIPVIIDFEPPAWAGESGWTGIFFGGLADTQHLLSDDVIVLERVVYVESDAYERIIQSRVEVSGIGQMRQVRNTARRNRGGVYFGGSVTLEVDRVPVETIIQPADEATCRRIDLALTADAKAIGNLSGGFRVAVDVGLNRPPSAAHVAVGLRVELMRGDTVTDARRLLVGGDFVAARRTIVDVLYDQIQLQHAGASFEDLGSYSVRLTSDPMVAIADIRRDEYWVGTLDVPLRMSGQPVRRLQSDR